jgi:hypothetical protein
MVEGSSEPAEAATGLAIGQFGITVTVHLIQFTVPAVVDRLSSAGQPFARKCSTGRELRRNAILLKRIKVIWGVQSQLKKFSVSRPTQISRISIAVPLL